MSLEIVESNDIKMVAGTRDQVSDLDLNTIQGVLGKVVTFVSEQLEQALESESAEFKDMPMHALVSMTATNIIINMIACRLASDNKDRRLFVLNRFMDELKDITLRCFTESESFDLHGKAKN